MENNIYITKEEYNNIPVYYCMKCRSLKIRILNDTVDYCDICGSTHIGTTHIDNWLNN